LGIDVNDQHLVAFERERCRYVDGGGRLSNPALLIRDRDDPRVAWMSARVRPVFW
jgi:hypothetical protein